jgi:hypothetical protein
MGRFCNNRGISVNILTATNTGIPSHEASAVAEALVTNFCHFGTPRELHSDRAVSCAAGSFTVPQNEHHAPALPVGRYGGVLHQDGQRAPMKVGRIRGTGTREIAPLSPSLQDIHS